jgi:hypothetical protein
MVDYSTATKHIIQYAHATGACVKKMNISYQRSDGDALFPNLADANAAKQAMAKSHKRYVSSTNHDIDGVTRRGTRGNLIHYTPLPEDFDINELVYRKPGAPGYQLPPWTAEAYNFQFDGNADDGYDEDDVTHVDADRERNRAPRDERNRAPRDERNRAPRDERNRAPRDERNRAPREERNRAPREERNRAPRESELVRVCVSRDEHITQEGE